MKSLLPQVFVAALCLAPLAGSTRTPAALKVVPLGQLSGPMLRQMMATSCGPFFTMVPTDANGGGLVNLAVDTSEDMAVVSIPVKAIHVSFCDTCEAPLFKQSGNESSIRADLTISHDHWKMSPCLKSAKISKR